MKPGGYPLTRETYPKLLDKITRSPHGEIPPALKENILDYYADRGRRSRPRRTAKLETCGERARTFAKPGHSSGRAEEVDTEQRKGQPL